MTLSVVDVTFLVDTITFLVVDLVGTIVFLAVDISFVFCVITSLDGVVSITGWSSPKALKLKELLSCCNQYTILLRARVA